MNNIFDIKRFGQYFLYDLRRAKNNYGLSLLLMGLIPIILYIVGQLFSLITGSGILELPDVMKFMGIYIVLFVVILGAGTKIYGFVTEKRAGSDFLMLPASTFEKWLSMVLIVCVALPVVLFALLFVSDGLMGLVFPHSYGGRLFDRDFITGFLDAFEEEGISFNYPALICFSWCENILVFTLGAICFKKGKIGKTILCIMGVATVVSTLLVIIFGTSNIDAERFAAFFDSADKAVSVANWTISIFYLIIFGLLLGGIWYRLRTIKQ